MFVNYNSRQTQRNFVFLLQFRVSVDMMIVKEAMLMTKEEYIKYLIKSSGYTIKSFAEKIDLPYSTLLSMLNRGLDGAAVQNVFRVCKELSITVEELQGDEDKAINNRELYLTEHEKNVIEQYRKKREMQPAVDTLLGIYTQKTTFAQPAEQG